MERSRRRAWVASPGGKTVGMSLSAEGREEREAWVAAVKRLNFQISKYHVFR